MNGTRRTYLIFDLETILDEDLFRECARESQKQKLQEDDEYFPPPVYNIPIAIAVIYCDTDSERYWFKSLVSHNPKDIVEAFFKVLNWSINTNKSYPVLVSHNGTRFDLQILLMRALKHFDELSQEAKSGLREYLNESDRWENERANYTGRFSSFNIDTLQIFPRTNLKALGRLLGFPVKTIIEGGHLVKNFYMQNRLEEIARYCAEDVLTLARIYSKLLEAKGEKPLVLPLSYEECEIEIKE